MALRSFLAANTRSAQRVFGLTWIDETETQTQRRKERAEIKDYCFKQKEQGTTTRTLLLFVPTRP
jgi:hypothetical protein